MSEEMEKVELNEQGKKNVRIRLQNLELEKNEHDVNVKMSSYLIDNQISNKIITERMSEIRTLLETKKDFDGKDLPKSQLIELEANLHQLDLEMQCDLPMKRERIKLSTYMNQEQTMNAKDKEIKDLTKALRTGFIEVPKKEETKEENKKEVSKEEVKAN